MGKACMMFLKQRWFINWEIDAVCFNNALLRFAMERLARSVLNEASDTKRERRGGFCSAELCVCDRLKTQKKEKVDKGCTCWTACNAVGSRAFCVLALELFQKPKPA